jgi:hypothetical protein
MPNSLLAPPVRALLDRLRVAVVLAGVAALAVYLLPGLPAPGAHWPLWDVRVYWWGGQQAAASSAALYSPSAPFRFTYPPFAALIFSLAAAAPVIVLKAAITAGSLVALPVLCGQSLGAAGVRRRPETVFAVSALALLTWPVAYTLHLGEVNLILAALAGADLLRRRDGGWWQGIGIGLAAGIKLTPLIFVAYLLLTGRLRAAAMAAVTFAATVAAGVVWLPSRSRVFWLTTAAWRRRSLTCTLAAAAAAAVFSWFIPIPWPGHPPRPGLQLASDLYVLCGLAVLVGTALALTRERAAARRLGSGDEAPAPGGVLADRGHAGQTSGYRYIVEG